MLPYEYYLVIFLNGSHAISAILAAVTVYLYVWLPNVQNIQGTCIFHYSLNIAILHAVALYYWITGSIILPETVCYIEVNVLVFVMAAINTWSIILSYNTWKQIPRTGLMATVNPGRRLNYYRLIGYGIPFLYQLVIIRLHNSLFALDGCLMAFLTSLEFPITASTIMNVFFFLDSQKKLEILLSRIAASENESPGDKILLKRMKYKFRMNLRLCTTMNIPFAISVILTQFIRNEFTSWLPFIFNSLNGTLIFLVAVAFRKRVIRGVVRHADHLRQMGCIGPVIPAALTAEDDEDWTDYDDASLVEEDRITVV